MPSTHFENSDINKNSEQEYYKFFFYGTLKKNQPNHHHLVFRNVKFVCEAVTVDKWPLIVASDCNLPFLLNKKGCGYNIHGEIYMVDLEGKLFLDEFEGVDEGMYSLMKIDVKDNKTGNVHEVHVYLLENFKESLLDGAVLLENYSSINPYYESYKKEQDIPENNDFILKQIK